MIFCFILQGERSANTALKVLGKIADALLALRVPGENMISISTSQLNMTLGRHSPNKLAGLQIKGGSGSFILPPWPVTGTNRPSFVDTQVRDYIKVRNERMLKSIQPWVTSESLLTQEQTNLKVQSLLAILNSFSRFAFIIMVS